MASPSTDYLALLISYFVANASHCLWTAVFGTAALAIGGHPKVESLFGRKNSPETLSVIGMLRADYVLVAGLL